jgi:diguanylate cyclase (GGDEF)-like protein
MKIKKRMFIISLFTISSITIITCVLFYISFFGYISRNKDIETQKNFDTINKIMHNEQVDLHKKIIDWSHWDDTYNFINNKNNEYINSNLEYTALQNLNLSMVYFLDLNGNIIYDKENNLNADTKDLLINKLSNIKNTDKSGLIAINNKVFIVEINRITNSNETAEPNGTIVFVEEIGSNMLEYINDITDIHLTFENITNNENYIKENSNNSNYLLANKVISDINGDASIKINISKIYSNDTIHYFYIFILCFLILIFIITYIYSKALDRFVLGKIIKLNDFINNIRNTKDTTSKLAIDGNDEFSELAESTNGLFSELNLTYKEILFLSYSDNLTKLNNRFFMEKELCLLDTFENSNYYIIMGDLNGLKLANDALGHEEGDKLLLIVSNILKECCEPDDIISRWGGDEFVILVKNKDKQYVVSLIDKIKEHCKNTKDFHFNISIGLGYATKCKEKNCLTTGDVMKLAEEKMYRNKLMESNSSRHAVINSLMQTLNEKHSETEEHTLRIAELSLELGKSLNLSQDKLNELELLALLHDIGKIGIPENILMKPDKLTPEEWVIMKTHSDIGYRIAKSAPDLAHIADEILAHHEKYDGTGYPNGLKENQIPLISRIINVVDSFDAITSKRIYKDALSFDYAIKELKDCSGTQFDPLIVDQFIKIISKK